jgi:glycosyltransferase involved in cell wall biosynthesis
MKSLSVIVPTCNDEATIRAALRSAADALSCLHADPAYREVETEVIVVDDGSTDDTLAIVVDCTRGDDRFKLFHRDQPSSPGCARNSGVAASRGELLCFLDADDLYHETHILECCRAMRDRTVSFVKTGVCVSESIHDDWRCRIVTSLVLNLCVRRPCHDFIGGFPDYYIYRRQNERLESYVDVFRMIEDVHYNNLLARFFRRADVAAETVRYQRRPGNSFDRQFEKFQHAYGAFREEAEDEFEFRVRLSKMLMEYHAKQLEKRLDGKSRISQSLVRSGGAVG